MSSDWEEGTEDEEVWVPDEERAAKATAELRHIGLEERIRLVAADVASKADRFRDIDGFELAKLLGIEDPEMPEWPDWDWFHCAEPMSLGEIMDEMGCEWADLRDWFPADAVRRVESALDDPNEDPEAWLGILTEEERDQGARRYLENELWEQDGTYMTVRRAVRLEPDIELWFEGDFVDGECDELLTPYDHREGKFVNLDECVWIDPNMPRPADD